MFFKRLIALNCRNNKIILCHLSMFLQHRIIKSLIDIYLMKCLICLQFRDQKHQVLFINLMIIPYLNSLVMIGSLQSMIRKTKVFKNYPQYMIMGATHKNSKIKQKIKVPRRTLPNL